MISLCYLLVCFLIGHIVRGKGQLLRKKITDPVTPEIVQNNWDCVTDMSQAERLDSIQVNFFI